MKLIGRKNMMQGGARHASLTVGMETTQGLSHMATTSTAARDAQKQGLHTAHLEGALHTPMKGVPLHSSSDRDPPGRLDRPPTPACRRIRPPPPPLVAAPLESSCAAASWCRCRHHRAAGSAGGGPPWLRLPSRAHAAHPLPLCTMCGCGGAGCLMQLARRAECTCKPSARAGTRGSLKATGRRLVGPLLCSSACASMAGGGTACHIGWTDGTEQLHSLGTCRCLVLFHLLHAERQFDRLESPSRGSAVRPSRQQSSTANLVASSDCSPMPAHSTHLLVGPKGVELCRQQRADGGGDLPAKERQLSAQLLQAQVANALVGMCGVTGTECGWAVRLWRPGGPRCKPDGWVPPRLVCHTARASARGPGCPGQPLTWLKPPHPHPSPSSAVGLSATCTW